MGGGSLFSKTTSCSVFMCYVCSPMVASSLANQTPHPRRVEYSLTATNFLAAQVKCAACMYIHFAAACVAFSVCRFVHRQTLSVAHEPRVDHGEIHRAIVLGSEDDGKRTSQ